MMQDTNFLRSLVEFDKDNLNDKQVKEVKKITPDLKLEEVKHISQAGAGLLKWVNASAYSPFSNPLRRRTPPLLLSCM